jgi:DNA-binding NtrC family response regulator
MMPGVSNGTETFGSESPAGARRGMEWALVVALDCERLAAPPLRLALARLDEVEIGRARERVVHRTGSHVRLEVPDRWASQTHTRLRRSRDGWMLDDARSKNGTWVNGVAVEHRELQDGDVVECGGTFLVVRRAAGPIRDLEVTPAAAGPLATLSPELERELQVVPKIARSRVPVLLRGDSGTGKEVLARAVHALSRRAGELVAVNCGAIPTTLIESELFGSRRGAFSGAEERPGLVRSADRGTLFLDEVAELPASSQAALLRVLQDGELMPLGASKSVTVDVRVVAATNQPVEERIADGRFRRDLYARLRGYELCLPPLRTRIEDLGLLIATLIARLDGEPAAAAPRRLSRSAARALFQHPFPLQVRELEQVLRAALAVAAGPEIGLEDLPPTLRELDAGPGDITADGERGRLAALLQKHDGNVSAVARELATSRSQVHRLLTRHGLATDSSRRR